MTDDSQTILMDETTKQVFLEFEKLVSKEFYGALHRVIEVNAVDKLVASLARQESLQQKSEALQTDLNDMKESLGSMATELEKTITEGRKAAGDFTQTVKTITTQNHTELKTILNYLKSCDESFDKQLKLILPEINKSNQLANSVLQLLQKLKSDTEAAHASIDSKLETLKGLEKKQSDQLDKLASSVSKLPTVKDLNELRKKFMQIIEPLNTQLKGIQEYQTQILKQISTPWYKKIFRSTI